MMKKKQKKFTYLVDSFANTLKQEGVEKTVQRFYYFLRYGKGVTSKNDYDRFRKEQKEKPVPIAAVKDIFDTTGEHREHKFDNPIDIVIPVYNGFEYLRPLFESIIAHTRISYRLIVIDDASPDERVYPFLQSVKEENSDIDIILIQNKENLGFVKTVNKAVKLTKNHFALLNTDIEVPNGWIERLMIPVVSSQKVASTTPMTNAGTIFSFPQFLEDNEIIGNLTVDQIDKYFKKIDASKSVEVPTGMGFCMGFNKEAVKKIGMFDAQTFCKGYGEENDWCQRSISAGYKNIAVPNLFVYHKHGGSFPSEQRQKLIADNLVKLNKKHPGYNEQVQEFIKNDPFKKFRDFLITIISANEIIEQRPMLIFDHEIGGGANVYTKKFVQKHTDNGRGVFIFSYNLSKQLYYVRYFFDEYEVGYEMDTADEFLWLLQYIDLSEIIVSQVVSYPEPLNVLTFILRIAQEKNSKLTFLVHDYFCVCPSYTLLNQDQQYCAVPQDMNVCEKCLQVNKGQFKLYTKNTDIAEWREKWGEFLVQVDEIICFSNVSINIIKKAYSQLDDGKITFRPHIIDHIDRIPQVQGDNVVTIGVLGGINFVKGAKIVREMVEIIENENKNNKIVIIGEFSEKIKSNKLIVHGKYKQNEIIDLVEKYNIDIFLIPSIWPETFSYTAEEVMQMNMPLAVFDLGAPAERVKNYAKGIIIPNISAQSAIKSIQKLI